ncbi:MAG: hypothetical protein HQ483_07155 [Rhodospirillales bacterium]|nr:hypothetical protein [Rhodospirillales bacterium]
MSHRKPPIGLICGLSFGLLSLAAQAGEPSVLDATVKANTNGTYAISATLFHKDEGWKHYANKFEVLSTDGTVLATRILYHPHVNEQPFTRTISSVTVPVGVTTVIVRAHDLVHKYGDRTFTLQLPRRR